MNEERHERHNRIAAEIAVRIWREIPQTADRLVVLESICAGVIGMMTKDMPPGQRSEARQSVAGILSIGIKERLETQK